MKRLRHQNDVLNRKKILAVWYLTNSLSIVCCFESKFFNKDGSYKSDKGVLHVHASGSALHSWNFNKEFLLQGIFNSAIEET